MHIPNSFRIHTKELLIVIFCDTTVRIGAGFRKHGNTKQMEGLTDVEIIIYMYSCNIKEKKSSTQQYSNLQYTSPPCLPLGLTPDLLQDSINYLKFEVTCANTDNVSFLRGVRMVSYFNTRSLGPIINLKYNFRHSRILVKFFTEP